MARSVNPLTATAVKNAKATGKQYNLADGGGLTLRVSNTGSKRWLLNYSKPYTKKRSNMGLGPYPEISLARARELAADARALLADNIDPIEHREAEELRLRLSKTSTLRLVGEEWLKVKRTSVSAQQADKLWRRLELHVLPTLGERPIQELQRMEIIRVLRPIEAKGSLETVKRLCQVLNQIMTYAANVGYIQGNNLTGINKAFEIPKARNMPSLSPERLPDLMRALHNGSLLKPTRLLIEFQLHTMARPNEVAAARWDEFDLDEALWVIPAERMKMRKEHKVPLSPAAMELVLELREISGHREYVFTKRGDPLGHASTQTANTALKRLGFQGELVSHGLRSLASTTLNEEGFDPDLIEAALAHQVGSQVRAIYNRAD